MILIRMIKVVLLSTLIITNVFAQEDSDLSIDSLKYYAVHYSINETSRYKNLEQKVKKLIEESTDNEYLFYAYSFLGEVNAKEGNVKQALEFLFLAIEYEDYIQDKNKVANVYENLVEIYKKTGDSDQMFESFKKTIDIKKSINDWKGIELSYLGLTRYYRREGNYMEAFKIEYKALDYFESNSDTIGILVTYHDIAMTYKSIGSYTKAMEVYNNCQKYLGSSGFDLERSLFYNGIGTLLLKTGDYQEALNYFRKSLAIENEFGDKFRILKRYNNIGLAYTYLHNFDPALEYFNICIKEYKEAGNWKDLSNLYNSLGMYYQEMNLPDSSIIYYLKSIEIAERYNLKELLVKSALWISEMYEANGQIDLAYNYLKRYQILFAEIDKSNVIWDVTAKEYEYIRQKELLLKKVEKRNSVLFFSIVASTLILFILVFWIIVMKQKVKIHQSISRNQLLEKREVGLFDEIKKQNQELISKILQISDSNSEIKLTIKKLENFKKDMGVHAKQKIQQLINDMERSSNDTIWKEFEYRFIKVNPLLHEKLITAYPNLTGSEKRLCALLYLNFSPLEISQITKQSYRSVLVAKSRLRRKLQIKVSKNINSFLLQLMQS